MHNNPSEIKARINRLYSISKFPISLVSGTGETIYCCPMEESYFISPALMKHCLENSRKRNVSLNQMPYMSVTDDEIIIGIVALSDDTFIVAGPVSTFPISINNNIITKYETFFNADEFSRVSKVFCDAANADAYVFANFIAEMYDLFHQKSIDINDILIGNSIIDCTLPQYSAAKSPLYVDNSVEINWFVKFENSIHSAIEAGSQSSLDILWNTVSDIPGTDMNMNIDGLQYIALSFLTVYRRAALEGGADSGEVFELYDKTLKKILACKTSTDYYSIIIRSSYLFCKSAYSKKLYGPYISHAKKCEKYIQMNIGQKITIHTLALLCGLSDRQICRIFSVCFNCGVTEFIHNEKIRQAKIMLLSGEYKIIDISNQLGYSSQSHFSKMFLRVTGCTPNEYRNKNH